MSFSILNFFKIGIGPSSSHTIGPITASRKFVSFLKQRKLFGEVDVIEIELYGSLALTGVGHGTPIALKLGLMNYTPDKVTEKQLIEVDSLAGELKLGGVRKFEFTDENIIFNKKKKLPYHPNGLEFRAFVKKECVATRTYYSIGGGFVVTEENAKNNKLKSSKKKLINSFKTATELFTIAENRNMKISEIMMENEKCFRKTRETKKQLRKLWKVMQSSIDRGITARGMLPGKINVERRAGAMYEKYLENDEVGSHNYMDYLSICAIAVNEENADMHQVVTAPTNGAAGIIPATMTYIKDYVDNKPKEWETDFFLTAGAIAMLYKMNASISGAEVGCQGEIGVACSMAAGALTEILGGNLKQVENAAEIAMEHNLGLTCDPVAGLVQIPCIERNAIGVGKAINASRMAMLNDRDTKISLDDVIKTMKETGDDMKSAYKETSQGGLAVNVTEC
jgi:L-serine dehydratase